MSIVLFGAGKIARGFIGHLLWKAGYAFRFVEYNPALVKLLKERKRYAVRILGEEIRIDTVTNFDAWGYEDIQDIEEAIASDVDTMFVSVGGKNLQSVGMILKSALRKRMEQGSREPINIFLFYNFINPSYFLKITFY
ncbi:Mannitol-1-phosphate 5-dehydrogenase [bioreactor metagenome]|uniref:Mannitol-1-phosphate 5-dehydrogenase n=1 Tax=bioreactor metagenome TaxID=1076179 RepID=A0A645BJM6_9ZZZZ